MRPAGAWHSCLFVPGNRPERYAKAAASGCHAVIVDLEDSVPAADKAGARDAAAGWLREGCGAVARLLRVNAADSADFAADAELCRAAAVDGVVLAKAESVEQLDALAAGAAPLLPLIETARGLAAVAAIAAHPRTARLLFGALDLQLDLDIEDEDEGLLLFRSQLVLASRLAGLPPPLDGVTATLRPEALSRDARRARRLGFGGKLCIHPVQVAAVNAAFLPSEAQLAWARRVCAAAERAGGGATTLDGVMVDLPVLRRAERVLAAAGAEQARTCRFSKP